MSFGAGLCNPEEFSFTIDENPCEQTIQNLGKKSETLKKKQQISQKCRQECNVVLLHDLNYKCMRIYYC